MPTFRSHFAFSPALVRGVELRSLALLTLALLP
jgi:hypothetical protein